MCVRLCFACNCVIDLVNIISFNQHQASPGVLPYWFLRVSSSLFSFLKTIFYSLTQVYINSLCMIFYLFLCYLCMKREFYTCICTLLMSMSIAEMTGNCFFFFSVLTCFSSSQFCVVEYNLRHA